jgi:CheY-like chemotaxis protein
MLTHTHSASPTGPHEQPSQGTPRFSTGEASVRDRRVLVAGGDDVLRLVEAGLRVQHCSVASAATTEQALATIQSHRPDLIVLNVGTDGIDGVCLAQQLKRDAETADIPVLAIMGQSRPDLHYGGQSVGFDAVLLKPVTATTVAQVGGLLIERAGLLARLSTKLGHSSRELSGRSETSEALPAAQPALIAAVASRPASVAPRCRSCGNDADSHLVRTTASSLHYRCGSCHAQWRNTRRAAMPQDDTTQVAC